MILTATGISAKRKFTVVPATNTTATSSTSYGPAEKKRVEWADSPVSNSNMPPPLPKTARLGESTGTGSGSGSGSGTGSGVEKGGIAPSHILLSSHTLSSTLSHSHNAFFHPSCDVLSSNNSHPLSHPLIFPLSLSLAPFLLRWKQWQ